ncbi:MAG: 16S rRNA (guanine(966)-N(2))-methyltransferase RsmD [Calditrichia bacterium]
MRVIAGKYKGQRLYSAKNQSIRPTTDRVKEYIFDVLRDFVIDVSVLDLFSGAGSLGIEALSRGAAKVTFVDNSYNSTKILRKNLERLRVQEPYTIVRKNVLTFLRQKKEPFDLIFADPPFKWNHYIEFLPLCFLPENLSEYGIVVLESERTHEIEWNTNVYEVLRQKKYDRSLVTFFGRKGVT